MSEDAIKNLAVTILVEVLVAALLTPVVWVALHYAVVPYGQSIVLDDPVLHWDQIYLIILSVRWAFRGL